MTSGDDAIPPESLIQRLERRYGVSIEPGVELERSAESTSGSPASSLGGGSVLGRLALRGGRVSRYRLADEVARGGMGVILSVWDEDLRRKLAMKVALGRDGGTSDGSVGELDPRILARFLEEAQITGQLEHPGIVPVHELGLDEQGRVFFTMPLVEGRDLERVLELVERGAEGWSIPRALGVLSKVCEAMAFAHSKGVVHRDLKPANVMVGRFGEVYVMDWGLARVRGKTDRHDLRVALGGGRSVSLDPREGSGLSSEALYTMDGDVLGTPAYMPPEQARGELERLDERSDVYALGAILYRLLAGTAPFVPRGERRSAAAVLGELLKGPPEPLERLAPNAPPELVAICARAMAREHSARYADMQELGEDLRAYLEGRVVRAYEAGAWAEARKWVRRNKALSSALGSALLLLVAGLTASVVLKGRADAQATLAEEQRERAERNAGQALANLELAEERRVEAERSAEDARRQTRIAAEVNAFLNNELLAAVAPEHRGIDVTVRQVLESASLGLGARFAAEPLVEAELRLTIGTGFERLGRYEQALTHLERALALRQRVLGERSEPTLIALAAVAGAQRSLGRTEEALTLYDQALDIARELHGEDHKSFLSIASDRTLVLRRQGRFAEALEELYAVLDGQERLFGDGSVETISTRNNLALALQESGRPLEAAQELEHLLDLCRRSHGERHPQTLTALQNLAIQLQSLGRYGESAVLLEESVRLHGEVFGEGHPRVAAALTSLGIAYLESERPAQAEPALERAVELATQGLGAEHPETLLARGNWIALLERTGRGAQALPLRLALLEDERAQQGPEHPATLRSQSNLATLYLELGRLEEAEEVLTEVLDAQERVLGEDHPSTIISLENLGNVYFSSGRPERSEELLEDVLERRLHVLGEDHPDVAKTRFNLGLVAKALGRGEMAKEHLERALAHYRAAGPGPHPLALQCLRQLGDLYTNAKEFPAAILAYREALEGERLQAPQSSFAAYLSHQIGHCSYAQGLNAEALDAYRDALALRRAAYGDGSEVTRITMFGAARALLALERFAEAETLALELESRIHEVSGPDHPHMTHARRLLTDLYTTWNRPADAERWR